MLDQPEWEPEPELATGLCCAARFASEQRGGIDGIDLAQRLHGQFNHGIPELPWGTEHGAMRLIRNDALSHTVAASLRRTAANTAQKIAHMVNNDEHYEWKGTQQPNHHKGETHQITSGALYQRGCGLGPI